MNDEVGSDWGAVCPSAKQAHCVVGLHVGQEAEPCGAQQGLQTFTVTDIWGITLHLQWWGWRVIIGVCMGTALLELSRKE